MHKLGRMQTGAAVLLLAGVIALAAQRAAHRPIADTALEEARDAAPVRLLQELASAHKSAAQRSELRRDLSRLARDIDAADRDKRVAVRNTDGLGMRHESARSLLERHSSAGVMRRLDDETSKLLDRWFGKPRQEHASQRQLRDKLAFGSRAFRRVERERGEARERSRNERRARERTEMGKGVQVPGAFGVEQHARKHTEGKGFSCISLCGVLQQRQASSASEASI